MLFSFSQLNQDFNCFSFPSYIVFPFSSRNKFIISFSKRSRRNSIPINTLYREVDYYYYVLINKSLLEMFSLLFCLLAQCSYGTQVSWKSCNICVLQILHHNHSLIQSFSLFNQPTPCRRTSFWVCMVETILDVSTHGN